MIEYNPNASLLDYREALTELQKEYTKTKTCYYASRIILAIVLVAIFITLDILHSTFSSISSKWLLIPIIISILFAVAFFKFSVVPNDNSFSHFLNCDYKGVLRDIRHDIRTVSYYISCLENGETPDPTYCYISSE